MENFSLTVSLIEYRKNRQQWIKKYRQQFYLNNSPNDDLER